MAYVIGIPMTPAMMRPGGLSSSESSLLTDLVAYWRMEEPNGTRVDATGNGNDLTMVGSVTGAQGVVNDAAEFFGSDEEYFTAASNPDLNPAGSFSIAAWVYLDSATGNMAIVDKWNPDTDQCSYHLFYNHEGYSNRFTFLVSPDGSSPGTGFLVTDSTYPLGEWHHVVAVFDLDAGLKKISVNGSTFQTQAQASPAFAGTAPLMIGSGWNMLAPFWDGKIDEVGLWHRALTQDEVTQLYNHGSGLEYPFSSTAPLRISETDFYYKLDEASGTRLDSGPHGLHLTSVNGVGYATGKVGNAAAFSRLSSQKLVGGIENQAAINGDYTICFWVKLIDKVPDTGGNSICLVTKWNTGGEYVCSYEADTDRFRFYSQAVPLLANTVGSPSVNTWYFYCITRQGEVARLSINAGPQDSATIAGDPAADRIFVIGAADEANFKASAHIDQVIKFPFALSQYEIEYLYNGGSGRELT